MGPEAWMAARGCCTTRGERLPRELGHRLCRWPLLVAALGAARHLSSMGARGMRTPAARGKRASPGTAAAHPAPLPGTHSRAGWARSGPTHAKLDMDGIGVEHTPGRTCSRAWTEGERTHGLMFDELRYPGALGNHSSWCRPPARRRSLSPSSVDASTTSSTPCSSSAKAKRTLSLVESRLCAAVGDDALRGQRGTCIKHSGGKGGGVWSRSQQQSQVAAPLCLDSTSVVKAREATGGVDQATETTQRTQGPRSVPAGGGAGLVWQARPLPLKAAARQGQGLCGEVLTPDKKLASVPRCASLASAIPKHRGWPRDRKSVV